MSARQQLFQLLQGAKSGRFVKRDFRKKKGKKKSLAKRVTVLEKSIETKTDDTAADSQACLVAGTIDQLTSAIPAGDANGERDGNEIMVKSILMRFIIDRGFAGNAWVRVMLVTDKRTNQAPYVLGDLLQDGTSPQNLVSPLDFDNAGRFNVHYDEVIPMTTGGMTDAIFRKRFIKKNIKIRFDASTPGIADMRFNSLSFVFIGSESTGGQEPVITYHIRLRYTDA